MSVTFIDWVWMGVGECDHFLAGCGWVWVSVTFIWLGGGERDLFLAGCWWVWVSVTFFWLGVARCG